MSLSADYHRYKQKLERLQTKVKKSELARKDLEIRLQRLMKERNECEKSASIHKSKYNILLEHERTRLNRNGELLEMLEEVHAKATVMATNTDRLKKLKNQQERVLINNWRRNAYMQQQIIYPNVLFPNAPQYLQHIPTQYEQHSRGPLGVMPTIQDCSPIVFDKPAIFIESAAPDPKSHADHSPNIGKSIVQQLAMGELPSSSLIPIYTSELLSPQVNSLHPRYHENQFFSQQIIPTAERGDVSVSSALDSIKSLNNGLPIKSQFRIDPSSLDSSRNNNEMTHLSFAPNQTNYSKHLNMSSPSQSSYPMNQFDQAYNKPLDASQTQFNKNPQYFHSNQPYSSIERENFARTVNENQTNLFPSTEIHTNQSANTPTSDFNSQEMSETMSRFLSQQQSTHTPMHPSMYDDDVRHVHSNDRREETFNATEIDRLGGYEKSPNQRNDAEFTDQMNKLTRPDTLDLKRSINTTSTSDSNANVTSSLSPQKSDAKFRFDDNSKSIPISKYDDDSTKGQHESPSDSFYSSMYPKDSNTFGNTNPKNADRQETTYSNPFENQENQFKPDGKIEKRRSSIDAGSFAKTLGHDADSEKESIAANLRRRYSVAANFLNLPNTTPNAFNFTPTSTSTNEYRNTNNFKNDPNRPTYDNHQINSSEDASGRFYSGGENVVESYPSTVHSAQIEQSSNRTVVTSYNDPSVTLAETIVPQYSSAVIEDANLSHTPANEENQQPNLNLDQNDNNTAYSNYAADDQTYVENAMEQLNLGDDGEQKPYDEMQPRQYDDGVDKIRTPHSKTVTWADDPNSNYKNDDASNIYESQNVVNETSADPYYTDNSEVQQIQQEYTADGSIQPDIQTNDSQYPYSNQYDSQYDNNQYQTSDGAADPNIYANNDYYYGNENQYDQYETQQQQVQQQQPQQQQQQEDPQQMQYYGNDAVVNSSGNVADDGYQQYPTDSTLQVQPKQDEYYTVSPGENYYSEYTNYDDNQTYSTNTNIGNSSQISTLSTAATEQIHNPQPQHDAIEYSEPNDQMRAQHVPNYLQSDTDDSQTGYQNIATNRAPQSQDSDFEFSTNS